MSKPFRKSVLAPRWLVFTVVLALITAGSAIAYRQYRAKRDAVKYPSIEIMAGQMIMIGFPGDSLQGKFPHRVAQQIREGKVGGVIMLGHNFKTKDDVIALTTLFREAANPLPPFIALDQEGGLVQRLGHRLGYESMPSASNLGANYTPKQAGRFFRRLAEDTRAAGFNMNLAPVVDLTINADNAGVGDVQRTYSADPALVTAFGDRFIRIQQKENLLPVLKHFPGHGSSTTDPHDSFADITATWSEKELEPFKALVRLKPAPAIMVGHLQHRELAGEHPTSLSKLLITGLLREKLQFDGLVICDDLEMSAIRHRYSQEEAVVLAINAGVDVLMVTNAVKPSPGLPDQLIAIISTAVRDGRIPIENLQQSWRRITTAKKRLLKNSQTTSPVQ